MTMDAAMTPPDQWERDLVELLGLEDDASRPGGARRLGMTLLAIGLVVGLLVLAAVCLGVLLMARPWTAPAPVYAPPVVRAVADRVRSVPGAVPEGGPAPGGGEAPRAQAAQRAVAGRADDRSAPRVAPARREAAVLVARGSASVSAEPRDASRSPPAVALPRETAGPPTENRRRADHDDDITESVSPAPREAPVAPTSAPPRARREDPRSRTGKTEAIDAIRLLRRQ